MLIDTHTHLNADQFADDVHETIERARANGISPMIVVGFDHKTIDRAMELVEAYDDLTSSIARSIVLWSNPTTIIGETPFARARSIVSWTSSANWSAFKWVCVSINISIRLLL